jgi:hypothetical protein
LAGSSKSPRAQLGEPKVPDGADYIEFILYDKPPTRDVMLTKHHLCLEVDDVAQGGVLLLREIISVLGYFLAAGRLNSL